MPHDRRAAQPLENADLDFLRRESDQPIKSGCKTCQILSRQSDN